MKIAKILLLLALAIDTEAINPLLLISFDGMRADKFDEFIRNNSNSNFAQFIKSGVRAEFMKPSFPTATFPVILKLNNYFYCLNFETIFFKSF